jgi:hypothetical protein
MSDFDYAPARGSSVDYSRGDLEFRLASSQFRAYSLNDFRNFKHVLLIAADTSQCSSEPLLGAIENIRRNLPPSIKQKIKFAVVDAGLRVNRPLVTTQIEGRWNSKISSEPTYLFDPLQIVSASLLFKSVGDFAILNPTTASIIATGSFADLESGLAEKFLTKGNSTAKGITPESTNALCDIQYANSLKHEPSFENDFAKPFSRTCLRCHSKSEAFNFFSTLDEVVGWRAMSLRTIRTMRMPGQHVPHFSGLLPYEASPEDLIKIVHWLDRTTSINDEWRKTYAGVFQASQQRQKKNFHDFRPDLVLETSQSLAIPATGRTRYIHLPLGQPFDKEIAVHAVRYSTNLNSVHHANLFAFDPKTTDIKVFKSAQAYILGTRPDQRAYGARRDDENILFETEAQAASSNGTSTVMGQIDSKPHVFIKHREPIIVTYSRRDGVTRFRPETAIVIPKGHQLGVQLHIEPSGREEIVPTKFELELIPPGEKFRPLSRFKIRPRDNFMIPPNRSSFVSEGSIKITRPISLLTTWFHAHYRAVASRIWFVDPKGVSVDLHNVPFYQLKMEQSREFWPTGVFIPAGSKIHFKIEYDNSTLNNANPDANASIKLGGSVYQSEMHYPRFVYVEED